MCCKCHVGGRQSDGPTGARAHCVLVISARPGDLPSRPAALSFGTMYPCPIEQITKSLIVRVRREFHQLANQRTTFARGVASAGVQTCCTICDPSLIHDAGMRKPKSSPGSQRAVLPSLNQPQMDSGLMRPTRSWKRCCANTMRLADFGDPSLGANQPRFPKCRWRSCELPKLAQR